MRRRSRIRRRRIPARSGLALSSPASWSALSCEREVLSSDASKRSKRALTGSDIENSICKCFQPGDSPNSSLSHVACREFIDAWGLPLERFKIECHRPNPNRIIELQRVEGDGIDVTNAFAFEDASIPRAVAARAFIDEPCIELSAVGIQPDLVAALEGAKAAASATCYPRLGSYFWNNGPTHSKCIAHAVLVFRSEVHQDGSERQSSRTRRGNIGSG
jgi:hypothetical protein